MIQRIVPTRSLWYALILSVVMSAYSGIAVWKESGQYATYFDFPTGLEAVVSLVIGLLLALHANRAFDRWWEGRILWGTLVNAIRNFSVKINVLAPDHAQNKDAVRDLAIAFPYALRDHLQDRSQDDRHPCVPENATTVTHVPTWIVQQLYNHLEQWKQTRSIQYGEFRMLDRELKVFLEVCGGCERIKNTPIPVSYRVALNHALTLVLLTLPWGLVNEYQLWTIPIVFLTTYFIVAAESIARDVERPFQQGRDKLDLTNLCTVIETSVHEIFSANLTEASENTGETSS